MGLYDRQELIGGLRPPPRAVIVGCGGVGSWAGLFLALAGSSRLMLMDGDNIDLTNLNRLPYPASRVGFPKSRALAEMISGLRPNCEVTHHGHLVPEFHTKLLSKTDFDLVLCCTDSLKSRQQAVEWAEGAGVPYLEAGAEAFSSTVTNVPPDWDGPAENEPGYRLVPSFVSSCVISAAVAVYQAMAPASIGDGEDLTLSVLWSPGSGGISTQTRRAG